MNTAAPTTAHKKLVGILLTIVFALTCLPAALAVDLNVDAGFYFKQSRGGTCTLASAAMMLRRRAYFDGRTDWVDVTENSVRSTAWSNGLAHSFTYREMQVAYATLPSNHQEKTQLLMVLVTVLALIASALAIANLVTAGVMERSSEIGLMKAVGAKDKQIIALFLTETVIVGLVGGVLGYGGGLALAQAIGYMVFHSSISFVPVVVGLVAVLVILVVLGASIPAIRYLLRLNAAEVLHGR